MSIEAPAPWTLEASRLPVAFAQVREDPAIDLAVLEHTGPGAHIAMIASGGCTAAALAAHGGAASITCIDPNPAQIALAQLKIALLETAPSERLQVLGHRPMDTRKRADRLAEFWTRLELPPDVCGPADHTARIGPDHVGRYEALFFALRAELEPVATDLQSLLQMREPSEQARWVRPDAPLGAALDRAFDTVMTYPNLVALFGDAATRNPRQPFARHFVERLRAILGAMPAAANPFLAQMLLGRFAPAHEYMWLRAPARKFGAGLTWRTSSMADALKDHASAFDLVHLSNILDWLSPNEACEQLDFAHGALRHGGRIIVRQLNSTIDIPALGAGFTWDCAQGAAFLARDRSFFYRSILIGRRK